MTIWHDNELFRELRQKWRQTLDSYDEEESLGKKPTDDLLIRALYFLLRFVRPDENQTDIYSVEEFNFLPYLMRLNHAPLPLILTHEEELDLDTQMTKETFNDHILISRYSSDPRIYSKATKQVVASLSLSGYEESLQDLKPHHSALADIINSLDRNHDEAIISIPNMETMNVALRLRGILLAEDGKGISSNELNWKRKIDEWTIMLQLAGCEGSVSLCKPLIMGTVVDVALGHLDSNGCCFFPTELPDGATTTWVGALIKSKFPWNVCLPL